MNSIQIAILASGSTGDVLPYIALGKGLAARGHFVRMITHENYQQLVEQHGLNLYPIEGNVQDIAQSDTMRMLIEEGKILSIMAEMARAARSGAVNIARAGIDACVDYEIQLEPRLNRSATAGRPASPPEAHRPSLHPTLEPL